MRKWRNSVKQILDKPDDLLRKGLTARAHLAFVAALWAVASVLFFFVAKRCRFEFVDTFPPREAAFIQTSLAAIFCALFAVTLAGLFYKLWREKAPVALLVLMAGVWMATLVVRISLLDYQSGDYNDFLSAWIFRMQDRGFAGSIIGNIGDYTPPYMYLIFLVSRFPMLPDLYLLKFASILFDYLCAYFVMKLVSLKYRGLLTQLACMMLALWAPTMLLNASYWAQCDALYTGFALGGLYFALEGKPYRGTLFFGISFALKLQAIFILPILLVLYGMRKISLKHVLMFPAGYVLMMIPALLAGKSIASILAVYGMQVGNYPYLVMGGASLYQLLPRMVSYPIFKDVALFLAMAVALLFCGYLYYRARRLTLDTVIAAALTLTMAMPLLLPSMHARYSFIADMLSIVFLAYYPRRWYVTAIVLFTSLVPYMRYLMGATMYDGWPFMLLSAAAVLCACLCAFWVARDVCDAGKNEDKRLASSSKEAYNL